VNTRSDVERDGLAYHRLHALASQFDAVLQSHRAMLLTSQSVLLSVAAFVSQGHPASGPFKWLPLTLCAMGVFMLLVWAWVIIPGSQDVAFCEWMLLRLEAGEPVGDTFYTDLVRWQRDRSSQKLRVLREHPLGKLLGEANLSRRILNYGLPSAFALCWISLIVFVLSR